MLVFRHWKARLIANLSVRIIKLPFDSIETLMLNSDFKISVAPGSAQHDYFRYSSNLLLRNVYEERIDPNIDDYKDFLQGDHNLTVWIVQRHFQFVYL